MSYWNRIEWLGWIAALLLLAGLCPALAHEGHDHAEPAPSQTISTGLLPRAAARSEAVEVVLIAGPAGLLLYLDDANNNAPIRGASLSLSGDALADTTLQESAPALYAGPGIQLPPGRHALTLVVEAGEVVDLLPLTLDIPTATAPAVDAPSGGRSGGLWWLVPVLVLGLIGIGYGWRRRRWRPLALSLLALHAGGVAAHGDEDHRHDHDHESAPAAVTLAPAGGTVVTASGQPLELARRLSEREILVPKSIQRLWGVRTLTLRLDGLAARAEWPGRVQVDPRVAGRIEAPEAGTLQPGPAGMPRVGQSVVAGETLLLLAPRRAAVDQARLAAERQTLALALTQATAQRDRLRQLSGYVAAKDVSAAEAEVGALTAQLRGLTPAIAAQPLQAPLSGMIVALNVTAGSGVEAGAVLLEVADPAGLIVEAEAPDAAWSALATDAQALWPGAERPPLALKLLDGGAAFRGVGVPWRFTLVAPPPGLAIGQPLRVQVQAAATRRGLALPQSALQRGEGGLYAWVHLAPEQFEQRLLRVAPLDAERVEVLGGLENGERVVVTGAVLLGQVR